MKTTKLKRLSKILSSAGIASRRKAEDLIFSGKVTVNGHTCKIPQTLVDEYKDDIQVNGQKIQNLSTRVYYILNKPIGYICSHERRSKKTKLIYDLFEGVPFRLFSAGRLDKETEGLLIVTNDGHFVNSVIHPSANWDKEYVAKTDCEITEEHLKTLSAGIRLYGVFIKPKSVKKVRKGTVKIIVKEGKKHEVRLLLEEAGLTVYHLKRTRIGMLRLSNLPVGSWRKMTEQEKKFFEHDE